MVNVRICQVIGLGNFFQQSCFRPVRGYAAAMHIRIVGNRMGFIAFRAAEFLPFPIGPLNQDTIGRNCTAQSEMQCALRL